MDTVTLERLVSRYEKSIDKVNERNYEVSTLNTKLIAENEYLKKVATIYEKQIETLEKTIDKLTKKSC